MMVEELKNLGEYFAMGLYEEPDRSLFYRIALGTRRYFETCDLYPYEGKPLYPSGVKTRQMAVEPRFLVDWNSTPVRIKEKMPQYLDLIVEDFYQYTPSVPPEHCVAGNMFTHAMPHYERFLKEGLLSYIPRIQKIKDVDMREGLLHLVEGIKTLIARYVDYLTREKADPKLIAALKKVPLHPAENIYEALVCWNFILYLDWCDNLGCLVSGLAPYCQGEDVTEIIANLYDNLDENTGWSMAIHTESLEHPLTMQCLEAAKGKRRPMIELFVDEDTPQAIWDKAFEVIRTHGGQPAFYNPNVLLKGLKERFPSITDEDLRKFCGGGCTESMIAGLSCVGSLDAGINLPFVLEKTIHNRLSSCNTFDEFYDAFLSDVQDVVNTVTTEIYNSQTKRSKYAPWPLRTLLIDDCIDRGLDFYNGGARYQWSIVNFAGFVNVIDSMMVIRDYIYNEKRMTAEELCALLKANDQGFLSEVKKHPVCHGIDHPEVNAFTKKITSEVYQMLENKKTAFGDGFIPCSIQFGSHVAAGQIVGATPDGREKGAPLCDSIAAIYGKDVEGPTALLNSVTAFDLKTAIGVPVLNFTVTPDFRNDILKALILTYMKNEGIQMQITCTSSEMLKEAYENPELHRNLVVRVGGYSEYFHRLSKEMQQMIISRSIQKEV